MSRVRSTIATKVAIVAIVLAACGGTSAEVTEFCESFVDAETLFNAGPGDDPAVWAGEMTETLTALEDQAPSEVSGAIETISGTMLPLLEAGDAEGLFAATESQDFSGALATIDTYMTDECGWDVTGVTAVEYAFDADLEGVGAGYNTISFQNDGNEFHEMALMRINDDTTEDLQELLQLPEEEAMAKVTMTGGAFAEPGATDTVFVDLTPGRYAIVCFLPVGATPDNIEALESGEFEGAPHFTQGMIQEFTVEE
jgi:hypothetical protein